MLKPEDVKMVVEYTEDLSRRYTEACLRRIRTTTSSG